MNALESFVFLCDELFIQADSCKSVPSERCTVDIITYLEYSRENVSPALFLSKNNQVHKFALVVLQPTK